MNGMEMLVNAALKATGFSRDQLDEGMEKGKALIGDFDTRLRAVENNVNDIRKMLGAIGNHLMATAQRVPQQIEGTDHAADVGDTRA